MAPLSNAEMMILLGLCLFFVMVSGLFSGAETGLYCINHTRLRLAAHKKSPSAMRLQKLLVDRNGLLFTTLLGTNLANYLAPICLTIVFLHSISGPGPLNLERRAELYTTLILTPVVFIFGEIVPKNIFQRNADRLLTRVSSLLRIVHVAFQATGILRLQRAFVDSIFRRLNRPSPTGSILHSRFDVYRLLREGAAEGALTRTQVSILERIHLLQTISVGSVMIPHRRTILLPADATCADVAPAIRSTHFSRMPVFRRNRRRIVGVVHLLDILTSAEDQTIKTLSRPPVEVSADMSVLDALTILQRSCRRLAIVVSRQGRCIGIVTVKDLVEEIVGELAAW